MILVSSRFQIPESKESNNRPTAGSRLTDADLVIGCLLGQLLRKSVAQFSNSPLNSWLHTRKVTHIVPSTTANFFTADADEVCKWVNGESTSVCSPAGQIKEFTQDVTDQRALALEDGALHQIIDAGALKPLAHLGKRLYFVCLLSASKPINACWVCRDERDLLYFDQGTSRSAGSTITALCAGDLNGDKIAICGTETGALLFRLLKRRDSPLVELSSHHQAEIELIALRNQHLACSDGTGKISVWIWERDDFQFKAEYFRSLDSLVDLPLTCLFWHSAKELIAGYKDGLVELIEVSF